MLERLKELQALLSHSKTTLKDAIDYAVTETIKRQKPKAPLHAPEGTAHQSRAEIKRRVWQRDQGRCGYVLESGKACGSRHALQYDHVKPQAIGGETTYENLRLRCRTHNRLEAIKIFGAKKMSEHAPAMR